MTKLQEIQVKQSEAREKLAGLLDKPAADRGDNYETELREATAEVGRLEVEFRAAVANDSDAERELRERYDGVEPMTPEMRERETLRERATVGGFILAALQGREPSGAELEYRSAAGVKAGIPVALFEPTRAERAAARRELRADAVTPVPSTGLGATLAPVQPAIFAASIAPRLGIAMPSVGSGSYSTMTISTSLTAAAKAKGDAQESTAAALTPATANPRRISGRLSLAAEDIAQVGVGNFEAALRQNLTSVMSDAYDNQCINGTGTAPNVNGLINQLTNPTNPTAVAGFDDFVTAFADSIDGLWASMVRDVSIVANVDAYKLSAKTFRDRVIDTGQRGGVSLGDESAASYLARTMGGWWTNKRMPATASNIARGIVHRMGRAGLVTAQHPVWDAISIDDIYTDGASAQRYFSTHLLVGDKVLIVQPAAYDLVEFKVA